MESKQTVLLLTDEASVANAVASALGSSSPFQTNGTYSAIGGLALRLGQSAVPAVLVDIDTDPPRMLAELEPVITRFQTTRFVALSRDTSSAMILRAMSAGVRHYLPKDTIAADLLNVLKRLAPPAQPVRTLGSMFTVLSASGGCGATTLAVNLADQLRLLSGGPALIVDFDLIYGGVGAYLGLQGPFSLADVTAKSGPVDPELVRSTAMTYGENLHALISPATANFYDPPPVELTNLHAVLDGCRQASPFTVIDAPRMGLELAASMAGLSLATLVVFQLAVKDVRIAQGMILALTERGVSSSRIVPVVNRYQKRQPMVRLEDAQRALPDVKLWLVRNDYPSAIRCLNYGQPVAQSAPRSALHHDLRELAAHLMALHQAEQAGKGE